MLRFVVYPRFPAPPDDENHRDGVDLFVQEGGCRVNDVAFAGILHVDNRHLACGEVVSSGESDTIPFVRGYDMVFGVDSVFSHKKVA